MSVERGSIRDPQVAFISPFPWERDGAGVSGPRDAREDGRTGHRRSRTPVVATDTVAAMRVLVVDDEVDLTDAIARGLRHDGYAVDVAYDGDEALEKVAVNQYDLVCLDITMPGTDGREVCRRIRADVDIDPQPRVLMLTARDALEDRVAGLDDGADDYLVKPFAFPELAARARSLLRRDSGSSTAVLRVADIELDTARHHARRGERELDLTAKEFALLRYFMTNVGQVLSQETLLEHVWDEHADPFTNTVRVTVGTVRRKLAAAGESQLIDTVIGRGYRLRDELVDAAGADAAVDPPDGGSGDG
jgi:DNA-binding response OmpR family regulator